MLHMSCIRGPLLCDQSSLVTSQCDLLWPAQQVQLGGPNPACTADSGGDPPPVDAGSLDAGPIGEQPGGGGAKSSGCALSAADAARATPYLAGLGGLRGGRRWDCCRGLAQAPRAEERPTPLIPDSRSGDPASTLGSNDVNASSRIASCA